jgi:hypothetical protein
MPRKAKTATVTIRRHRDGSVTLKATGGFDLRKIFPELDNRGVAPATEVLPVEPVAGLDSPAANAATGGDHAER